MKHVLLVLVIALAACGDSKGGGGGGGDASTTDDSGTGGDGSTGGDAGADAPFSGMCDPNTGPQCSNCMDDDNDTKIDGYDIQCSGPLDNDESSFATGIPGDNIDAVDQDCFFDGNSGAGNDGCSQHVCCLLGAMTKAECTQKITGTVNNPDQVGNAYEVSECYPPLGSTPVPDKCKMNCGPLAPPGCDCFGCCTVCDPADPTKCYNIALNPSTSPGCTTDTLDDPTICKTCTKVPDCGNTECGGDTCILCPGQDPSTLPSECNGDATCPSGVMECAADGTCPQGYYCSTGCCVGGIG